MREKQLHRGPLAFGDDDPAAVEARETYLSFPVDLDYDLSDRMGDVLRMLVAVDEPLSAKQLFFLFDGIERTWIDHSCGSMSVALTKLEAKGLVEVAGRPRIGSHRVKVWQPTLHVWRAARVIPA